MKEEISHVSVANYRKTALTYDKNGNKTKEDIYAWDSTDWKVTAERTIEYAYDERNLLGQVTNARNVDSNYEYDAIGRRTAEYVRTGSGVNTIEYRTVTEYDVVGNPIRVRELITKDPDGAPAERCVSETLYTYNLRGEVTSVIDALGNAVSFRYDGNGNQVAVIDQEGNVSRTYYDSFNRKIAVEDTLENIAFFEYDLEPFDLDASDDDYSYMEAMVSPLGARTTTEFDRTGKPVRIIDPLATADDDEHIGGITTFTYNDLGQRITATITEDKDTGALTKETVYVYNDYGELDTAEVNVVEGGTTTKIRTETTYDDLGRVTEVKESRWTGGPEVEVYSVVTATEYDIFDQVTRVIQGKASTTAMAVTDYVYDDNGNKVLEVRYGGADDELVSLTNDLLPRNTLESAVSNADSFTNANDQFAIKYEYDNLDRLTKRTVAWELAKTGISGDPKEYETDYHDDDFSTLTLGTSDAVLCVEQLDAFDRSTIVAFDILGRKIKAGSWVSAAFVGPTSWVYDKRGNVTTEDLSEDDSIAYTYDELSRVTKVEQGIVTLSESTYDEEGRLKDQTVHKDASTTTKTTYTYDLAGRVIETVADAASGGIQAKTKYVYDGFGRVTKIIDAVHADQTPETAAVSYEYDAIDRITQQTDADNTYEKTKYEIYASDERFTETTLRDTTTVVKRKFDKLNRLVKVEVSTGSGYSTEQTFTYDALSRTTLSVDYNGDYTNRTKARAVEYTYDHFSRITEEDQGTVDGTYAFVTEYNMQTDYDRDPSVQGITEETRIQYPGGLYVKRRFDNRGLLEAVGHGSEASFTSYADYTRDSQGRVADVGVDEAITFGNSMTLSMTLDSRGREISRIYEDSSSINIFKSVDTSSARYDRQGNILKETITYVGNGAEVKDYTYDKLARITKLDLDSASKEQWVYDKVGNWEQYRFNDNEDIDSDFDDSADVNQTRKHNPDNEIYDATEAITETINTSSWDDPNYDARGNMIYAPKTGDESTNLHFVYDWANRLIKIYEDTDDDRILDIPGDALKATYTYDASNRLAERTTTSGAGWSTRYVYDGPHMAEEYKSGTRINAYVYGEGIDDAIVMTESVDRYYVKDNRRSITALTDSSGNVVEIYRYSTFGHMTIYAPNGTTERSAPSFENHLGYTGQWCDQYGGAGFGLWYYRARFYHARLGRFLQRDPAGYVDGMNLYAYVVNNPLSFVDPSGMTKRSGGSMGDILNSWNSSSGSSVDMLGVNVDPSVPSFAPGGSLPNVSNETSELLTRLHAAATRMHAAWRADQLGIPDEPWTMGPGTSPADAAARAFQRIHNPIPGQEWNGAGDMMKWAYQGESKLTLPLRVTLNPRQARRSNEKFVYEMLAGPRGPVTYDPYIRAYILNPEQEGISKQERGIRGLKKIAIQQFPSMEARAALLDMNEANKTGNWKLGVVGGFKMMSAMGKIGLVAEAGTSATSRVTFPWTRGAGSGVFGRMKANLVLEPPTVGPSPLNAPAVGNLLKASSLAKGPVSPLSYQPRIPMGFHLGKATPLSKSITFQHHGWLGLNARVSSMNEELGLDDVLFNMSEYVQGMYEVTEP